jgi:putative photosynthetic complex assembly protein
VHEEAIDAKPFPKGMLVAAGAMVLLSLVFAATARLTDIGATRFEVAPVVTQRDLFFTDLPGGAVGVVDAASKQQIAALEPGQNGFVRVVMRGLARSRMVKGAGQDVPFRLASHTDGLSTLTDLATGEVVMLTAFGAGNAQAFEQFLAKGRKSP